MRHLGGLLVLGLCACGQNRDATADTATTAALVDPAPTPTVMILTPVEGDTTGPDVTVTLGTNGVLIQPAAGTRVVGVGHHHLFLDTVATPDGETIPPTGGRVVHIGTGDSTFTFRGLTAGPHEVIAVIGFGDHAAMPARRDTVRFVVRP